MYDHLSLLFWEKKIHYKTPRGIIKVNTQSTAHMDVDKEKEDKTARYNQAVKRHPDSSYKKTKKKKENHDTHIRNDLRNNSSISKLVACLFWIYSYSFPMDIDFFIFFIGYSSLLFIFLNVDYWRLLRCSHQYDLIGLEGGFVVTLGDVMGSRLSQCARGP